MRPAKSFWNQPTDWRSTWRCARQRTMVPTFGISDWLISAAASVWISGRANRMKPATSASSSPCRAQTSAGGVVAEHVDEAAGVPDQPDLDHRDREDREHGPGHDLAGRAAGRRAGTATAAPAACRSRHRRHRDRRATRSNGTWRGLEAGSQGETCGCKSLRAERPGPGPIRFGRVSGRTPCMPPRIARGFHTPLRAECHPSRTGAHRRAKPETIPDTASSPVGRIFRAAWRSRCPVPARPTAATASQATGAR